MFVIPDDAKKMRSRMLMWSAVCLFIALTREPPKNIALLGINLEGQETIIGWFVFGISIYYFLQFLFPVTLELLKHFLPLLYHKIAQKVTGDVYGLTLADIEASENERQHHQKEYQKLDYRIEDEAGDVYKKYNERINKFEMSFASIATCFTIIVGIAIPIVFFIVSNIYMFCFVVNYNN